MSRKIALVGGNFDDCGGRSSYFISCFQKITKWPGLNGGFTSQLEEYVFDYAHKLDALVWMPNVSNDVQKLLPKIKQLNPRLILVSSKQLRAEYAQSDHVGRLLNTKSNLGISIDNDKNMSIIDPLGNFWSKSREPEKIAECLKSRLESLFGYTRIPSERQDDSFNQCLKPQIDPEFLKFVQESGKTFSRMVHAVNPNRLLGNAATRCSFGMPGFRDLRGYWVSKRNCPKDNITEKDFVWVKMHPSGKKLLYLGDNKPSVDAPIQAQLFDYYKNVNFIIHGHVYANCSWCRARKTQEVIPCGCLEEVDVIKELFPDPETSDFIVNLKGHGCLLMLESMTDKLVKIGFQARPFPEKTNGPYSYW